MLTDMPTMHDLFAQLGLDHDEEAVQAFISRHRPLPEHLPLHQAPFWTPAQARFLEEQIKADAEWAPAIDQLNLGLHR